MAAMHGLCGRRRRQLTVIGISTPTATPLTPQRCAKPGWGAARTSDPPRRPRAPASSTSNRQPSRPSRGAQGDYDHGRFGFFSPEAVIQLADGPARSRTGRSISPPRSPAWAAAGELLALRWRAVDFDQEVFRVVDCCGQGELSRPKSGRGRERHAQPADLVFPGSEGGCMDSSALRRG
jgi:hypothetical protein